MPGAIYCSTVNQVITNSILETTLIGTGIGTLILPANYLSPGRGLKITASGVYKAPKL